MKSKKLLATLLVVLALATPAGLLGGCAPQQSSNGEAGKADSTSDSYPAGSLKAVHVTGQLNEVQEYNNKLCLSCHKRDEINAANEDYQGIKGFNPHKAHLEAGDCTTCHSVDSTSTLTCNSCHDAPLPEGWQSAEQGSGPIHSLKQG
ncbi:cytochrome c3 family protein [Gordonibacter sp.]|uniref:cytochrome c3 family protein n=2 Tax=Gordonibacter sp. TaxID=1968902 RepID=UPI002FC7AEEC